MPLPHNTIEPARRQTRITPINVQCTIVAFGRVANATASFRPRQAALTALPLDRDVCAGVANIHANRLFDTQICMTSAANAAPCAGNLGSGLYCQDFFTGVLTAGIGCNTTPSVFHQIRAFNSWIDQQIVRLDNGFNVPGTIPFVTAQGLPTRVRI